ncbi:ferritin-like domain-containing protein [Kitasatospora camelliae]|uniref:Ferritin-like domain-containing protein n=1 Tax=Kitasatospora camelliae TaxID=3156397 RepID=A0AAU8JTR6_9ACTN
MPSPTRRTLPAVGALTGVLLLLTACSGGSGHDDGNRRQVEDTDRQLRARAVAATDVLLAGYDAVIAGPGAAKAEVLGDLRDEVAEHRAALAEGLPGDSPAAPSGTAATASSTAPADPPASVAALAAAERETAGARLADLDAASPELARLLAAVSASDAVHAALLGDTAPIAAANPAGLPSPAASAAAATGTAGTAAGATPAAAPSTGGPSPTAAPLPSPDAASLQSVLSAEHAAVYGYGVVGAFLPAGAQREDGRGTYAAHQARRDSWQRLLSGRGASPTAAAAGYRLPFAVKDAATAGQLAAHIESQLTTVYADLVTASPGPLRAEAAAALRECALRAVHWGAELPALPGLADPAAGGDATDGPLDGATPGAATGTATNAAAPEAVASASSAA